MAEPGPIERLPPTSAAAAGPPSPAAGADAASVTHGFLFADLRDYTGYVEARGDRAGAALLERYRSLVRGVVAAARGAEIRTEGDSFYVVFGSVSAAVRAGLAIVTAAAATAADPDPIRVGVGIHAGETVETAEGFVGSAVNIAARLCAEARAGELVVSETVRGLTRTAVEVTFEPLGPRRLKGVEEPITVYRVVPRGAATGHAPAVRPGRRPTRRLAAGLGVAALVAFAAVAALVLFGGGRGAAPTPGPSAAAAAASPEASAGGSPAAAASTSPELTALPTIGPFPNEVEAAILAALPSTLAKTCVRGGTSDDARLAGFVGFASPGTGSIPLTPASSGGVRCRPASGAARLYIMKLVLPPADYGGAPADTYLGFLEGRYKLPPGSCATQNRAHESWTGPSGSGHVACMDLSPYDARPWIYFTFGNGRYLAFATRDDTDYDALYQWWTQLKTFLP
jgi:class 3 adenylate cyclase